MPWGEDLQSSFQWQVPWEHLQKSLLRKLDHGGFAQVYEVRLPSMKLLLWHQKIAA